MFLVEATAGDHVDVQGLCITGPIPHWMWLSGELAPSLIMASLGRAGAMPHPGSAVELVLAAVGLWVGR